jgi:hypothetical protein
LLAGHKSIEITQGYIDGDTRGHRHPVAMTTTTLPALIQQFFTDRLCTQMAASPNTIARPTRSPRP